MMTQTTEKKKSDWLSLIVTTIALGWIAGVSLVIQLAAWVVTVSPGEFLKRADIGMPLIFSAAALVQAAALLLPLVPLALFWRAPRYRAAFRTWLTATVFFCLVSIVRLIPSPYPQITLLLQFGFAASFALGLWFFTGRKFLERGSDSAIAIAIALGVVLALPWLLWGALGSIGDVVLGILNAATTAVAVTLIIARVWMRGIAQDARGAGWDIALGGFVLGGMLLIVGSAIGFSGTQVLMMIALSAFGWLLMDLTQIESDYLRGWNDAALAVLLGFAIGAPLLLLDPDAGILLASAEPGEMLGYALNATGIVVVGAWVLGLVMFLLRRQLAGWNRAPFAWAGAGVLSVLALVVYFAFGQPGLYGDRVFVILKDQADVSSAKSIADYDERRAFVYNTLTEHANQTQADLRRTLDQFGIAYTPYYLVDALEVSADLPVQWWLGTRPEVDRVLPSPRMRPLPSQPPVSQSDNRSAPVTPGWNLTMIGADRVWKELGVRGEGVLVGQSDSGVEGTHPELAAQYRGRNGDNDFNWLDPWNHSGSPQDIGGHGTHTLGSIVGKMVGVAPEAEWIGCVNLARNLGNPAHYLDCMQFMLAPFPQDGDPLRDGDPRRGAMVLNNSWGCPDLEGCDPNALLPAVRALRDAGVFVVASAGNDGPGCSSINSPLAVYEDVFSVGAVDRNRQLADFSSRGPVISDKSGRVKPDISAPGVGVLSAFPGGSYAIESGTSMAGPHIVGVVALMWSANPKLIGDIETTERILRETAQRADKSGEQIVCGDPNAVPNDLTGYGIVDAYAAVKRAQSAK